MYVPIFVDDFEQDEHYHKLLEEATLRDIKEQLEKE